MTAQHTDFVRANRERWFRELPGAREAYLTNDAVRLTTDSVDAALSMADREMTAQGIAADVREHVLTAAVFGTVYDYGTDAPGTPGTVHGIRPHLYRPEDDALREVAAEMPLESAYCHRITTHQPHNWADRALRLFACPGKD